MSRSRRRPSSRKPRLTIVPRPTRRAPSRWRSLGRGPKWLAATLVPIIAAVLIPGILPWITDRTRDLFGEPPLTAHSAPEPDLIAGEYWATKSRLTEPVSAHNLQDIRARGGVQLGTSGQEIILDSNRAADIEIEKITAVIERREPPLDGTVFVGDPQGSGEVALIDFHLDSGDEVGALVPDYSGDPGKPPVPYLTNGKVQYVEQGKREHIVIQAQTKKSYCLWRVRIDYSYRGTRSQLIVPSPDMKPFSTTAWAPHKVEYNMHTADGGGPQRYDCVATPARCRNTAKP